MTPDEALEAGRAAHAAGLPQAANPFSAAQGSPERPAAFAWRRGWRAARDEAEIAEQETLGHFRDALAAQQKADRA